MVAITTDGSPTIAALATGAVRAGVAVLRVSGPLVKTVLQRCTQRAFVLSAPRKLHLVSFYTQDGKVLDKMLAVFFPSPASYTGEDVCEFHLHGSPVLVKEALAVLFSYGVQLARPGEFTERAFLNGKMNLTQAEAVCDIIKAQTRTQLRAAQASLDGAFSTRVQAAQNALERIRVHLEAGIDFSDQEIAPEQRDTLVVWLVELGETIKTLLSETRRALKLQEGFRIVIVGAPNSGKSTLLNALAQEEIAIVTDVPGTTRDTLSISFDYKGLLWSITDTAGLRNTQDPVEAIGIEKAKQKLTNADAIWLLVDGSDEMGEETLLKTSAVCEKLLKQKDTTLYVYNKSDTLTQKQRQKDNDKLWISAKHAEGLERLLSKTHALLSNKEEQEPLFFARERHLQALETALIHIEQALEHTSTWDLFSEELRLVQHSFAEILGSYHHEHLLDAIFSRFCLGK